MAIKHQVWESAGGFIGMDQFNNPHVAAKEIVYLLEQIKRKGGKVAFVPEAIANHHTVIPTARQMLQRAYWNGISESILDYLLHPSSWTQILYRIMLDVAALLIFIFLSILFFLTWNRASAMYQLLRGAARLGRVISSLHLTGDWRHIQAWTLNRAHT